MARSVQSLNFDAADVECLVVRRGLGDFRAVLAANDGERVGFQLCEW